jgi:hypothetical protein
VSIATGRERKGFDPTDFLTIAAAVERSHSASTVVINYNVIIQMNIVGVQFCHVPRRF